jgi:hypothetical protein
VCWTWSTAALVLLLVFPWVVYHSLVLDSLYWQVGCGSVWAAWDGGDDDGRGGL